MIVSEDTKKLIEEETKTLHSFGLHCFDELINEPEVWQLIEKKVRALVPSYSLIPRLDQATSAGADAKAHDEKLFVLKTDTRGVEERISVL